MQIVRFVTLTPVTAKDVVTLAAVPRLAALLPVQPNTDHHRYVPKVEKGRSKSINGPHCIVVQPTPLDFPPLDEPIFGLEVSNDCIDIRLLPAGYEFKLKREAGDHVECLLGYLSYRTLQVKHGSIVGLETS